MSKEFTIYKDDKPKTIEIISVEKIFQDCAKVHAKYNGYETNGMLAYGFKYKHPILKFYTGGETSLDHFVIELNQELVEYIWNEIGHPYTGLLYGYTNNYKTNWED